MPNSRFQRQIYGTRRRAIPQGDGKFKLHGVREMIGTFNRYNKIVRREVEKLIHDTEAEFIKRARSAAVVGETGKLRDRIQRIRKSQVARGRGQLKGGVKDYARHGVAIEAGTRYRAKRPFFYKQLDVIGPKWDAAARDILARDAMRKAYRGR